MKVKVKLVKDFSDRGQPLVRAECQRCDHTTESFGTGEPSFLRCLALMREQCPNNEENYYVDEDGD